MPYWQLEGLRTGISMTFNQLYELELPRNGQLGTLLLYVRSTQNGQPFLAAKRKWRLIDYISKIEVIGDGSTVIKSFDGRQALANAFYDDGREPVSMWRHYSNTPHRQWIPLNFGRWFWDELYGLDLSRFNQVNLKITNDATATEFTTDITVDVYAHWLREGAGGFQGYFREEEWKIWTPVAAATEYNDLPVGLPIRRILLRNRPAVDAADVINNSSMHRLMSDIDFTFRTGQTRVYKGSLEALGHFSTMAWPYRIETMGMIDRNADLGFEAGVGYITNSMKPTATYTDAPATYPVTIAAPDIQNSSLETEARAADAVLEWSARGHAYMHNVPLWVARASDLRDMIDPDAMRVVKVDALCASGTTVAGTGAAPDAVNAESAIVLSRLVR
jgi:hypothetical protein